MLRIITLGPRLRSKSIPFHIQNVQFNLANHRPPHLVCINPDNYYLSTTTNHNNNNNNEKPKDPMTHNEPSSDTTTTTTTRSQKYKSPTLKELFKIFPIGLKKLYSDYHTYHNIEEASRTKRNAWNTNTKTNNTISQTNNTTTSTATSTNTTTTSSSTHHLIVVPRRQLQQQKRFSRDVQKVILPIIGYLIIPIFGNLMIVLMALKPRRYLSRHFLNESHVRSFGEVDFTLRLGYFKDCFLDFWNTLMYDIENDKRKRHILDLLEVVRYDAAGPVFDNLNVLKYILSLHHDQQQSTSSSTANMTSSSSSKDNAFDNQGTYLKLNQHIFFQNTFPPMAKLPRTQILNLAYSTGFESPIYWALPKTYIRKRLEKVGYEIIEDDLLLLQEKHHETNCELLTDEEVLDACLFRGLPTLLNLTMDQMRVCLTNHLWMMEKVYIEIVNNYHPNHDASSSIQNNNDNSHKSEIHKFDAINDDVILRMHGNRIDKSDLVLLILYLPIIRYGLRPKKW